MILGKSHNRMIEGLEERIFTAADLLVARGERIVFHETYGALGRCGTPGVTDRTLFDLASLTKILATTVCWITLASQDPEILDEPLVRWFPRSPEDRREITPRQLLAHCSGLPAWRPYYLLSSSGIPRDEFTVGRILAEPLEYSPGRGCLYSDLGFMLLGFILETETGESAEIFARRRIFEPLRLERELIFKPEGAEARTALTRPGERAGLVNDLNARALGGVAGHAGLFGTATGAAKLAAVILLSLKSEQGFFDQTITRGFCSRANLVENCTRALGFDTPSPEGSSSGRSFSAGSIGHTGFTGTSLWIDPETDLTVVLLTNRVFMGESDFRIRLFRPEVHDAIAEDLKLADPNFTETA